MAPTINQQDNDQRPLLVIMAEKICERRDILYLILGIFLGLALGVKATYSKLESNTKEATNDITVHVVLDELPDDDGTIDEESSDSLTTTPVDGWALYDAHPELDVEIPSVIDLDRYHNIKVVEKTDEWIVLSFVWDSKIGTVLVYNNDFYQSFYGWDYQKMISEDVHLVLPETDIHLDVVWLQDEGESLVSIYRLTE